MGGFSRVSIRFKDTDGKPRKSVVDRMSSLKVQAIFLRGAEDDFVITRKGTTTPIRREPTKDLPEGVTLEPKEGLLEGPGEVCYLVDDVLRCWSPTSE
jgi:hypothetical protein